MEWNAIGTEWNEMQLRALSGDLEQHKKQYVNESQENHNLVTLPQCHHKTKQAHKKCKHKTNKQTKNQHPNITQTHH